DAAGDRVGGRDQGDQGIAGGPQDDTAEGVHAVIGGREAVVRRQRGGGVMAGKVGGGAGGAGRGAGRGPARHGGGGGRARRGRGRMVGRRRHHADRGDAGQLRVGRVCGRHPFPRRAVQGRGEGVPARVGRGERVVQRRTPDRKAKCTVPR